MKGRVFNEGNIVEIKEMNIEEFLLKYYKPERYKLADTEHKTCVLKFHMSEFMHFKYTMIPRQLCVMGGAAYFIDLSSEQGE
jgi:hypothetical protein